MFNNSSTYTFVNEDSCDRLDKMNIACALIFDVKLFVSRSALKKDISEADFLFSSIMDVLYRSRTRCQNKRDLENSFFSYKIANNDHNEVNEVFK